MDHYKEAIDESFPLNIKHITTNVGTMDNDMVT